MTDKKKYSTIKNAIIRCQHCDFKMDVDHKKVKNLEGFRCPNCDIVLVNKNTLESFQLVESITDLAEIMGELMGADPNEKTGQMMLRITPPKKEEDNNGQDGTVQEK